MADKETDLQVSLVVYPDEKSVIDATNKIAKGVLNQFKDGHLNIPVELTEPFDKSNKNITKKLIEAQTEFIDRYNKLTAKGFSASAKELKEFVKAYDEYKNQIRSTKQNSSKQNLAFRDNDLNKIFQDYHKQMNQLSKDVVDSVAKYGLELSKNTKSFISFPKISRTKTQKEYNNQAVRDFDDRVKRVKESYEKWPNRLGSTDPKGYPKSAIDPSRTTSYDAGMSELSAHPSGLARQMSRSKKEALKEQKPPIITKPGEEAIADAIKNALKEGRNKNDLSEEEKNIGRRNASSARLSDILSGLEHNEPDASIEQFNEYLKGVLAFNEKAGKGTWQGISIALNTALGRYFNTNGKIGFAGDNEKGVGKGHTNAEIAIVGMIEKFKEVLEENGLTAELERINKVLAKIDPKSLEEIPNKIDSNSKTNQTTGSNSILDKDIKNLANNQKTQIQKTEAQTRYDIIENSAERVADSKEAQANDALESIAKSDASTGANTDEFSRETFSHQESTNRLLGDIKKLLINAFKSTSKVTLGIDNNNSDNGNGNTGKSGLNANNSGQDILSQIAQTLKNIDVNVGSILQSIIAKTGKIPNMLPAVISGEDVKNHPIEKEPIVDNTNYNKLRDQQIAREIESERTAAIVHNAVQKYVELNKKETAQKQLDEEIEKRSNMGVDISKVISSSPGFFGKIKDTLIRSLSSESEADRIMNMARDKQMRLRAQRLEMFGENNGRNLTDTGDKASVKRTKQLFGWVYKNDGTNKELFQDVRLTPGFNGKETIDTTKILSELNKVLSGPEMFKAQTGGVLRNLVGSVTGYIGMPSIEKSRAAADALNQIMSDVRGDVQDLVNSIQSSEMALKGMQEMGTAKFDTKGRITEDSSSIAQKTFIDLEEKKGVLKGALAEVQMIDSIIAKSGGRVDTIIKRIGFVMPELMKENKILQNINAGLDKNGKALKFQTRTGEILNYSFQLMARHIGQMVKNWLWMINPVNLIKQAFQDFASYSTKWQRTMNVIKYNIRSTIRPFMEWIAQQIVNIIGLVNALIKGIGSAFGQKWDLFDKDAANAEKIKENLEAAADVSAGFDELHDIGTTDPAEDFNGDIYTPQWEGLNNILENIGKAIGNITNTVSKWNFWDWLKLAGTALVGFLALKTLINWFKGKSNPLQTVAKGFSFLEKAVGWSVLILAFTEFTKALTSFVECMKSANWEDIAKSLIMLGGAFALLVAAIGGTEGFTSLTGMNWQSLFGLSALVGALDLFVSAIIPFMEVVKDMNSEDIGKSLLTLVGAFATLAGSAGLIQGLTALAGLNWQGLLGLSALVLVFSAFTAALVPFTEALQNVTTDQLMSGLVFLAGALVSVAVAVGILATVFTAIASTGVGLAALGILAGILLILPLVINSLADFIRSLGESGEGIKSILEGVAIVIDSIGSQIANTFQTFGNTITNIISTIANGIKTVLEPILNFTDSVIGKITDLATTVSHEIGETIRTVIKTTGDVIIGIIDSLLSAIPRLLDSILNFAREIGPAIENSADAIMRTITKLINFVISGIEYMINTLIIGSLNALFSKLPGGLSISQVSISRFIPQYEQGTNYVPNDGLAYLHQGEAVIPKKYNQPMNSSLTFEEKAYMQQMISTMKSLDNTMKQGIPVSGQFVQRGSDLVAVVNKTKSQTGADLLSNVVYAR